MTRVWTTEMRRIQSEKQSQSWNEERRAEASRRLRGKKNGQESAGVYLTRQGYRALTGHWGHPLAKDGEILEHRKVLFDRVGFGPHPCFWCRRPLSWIQIRADHLDGDRLHNDPANLVVACDGCNVRRGRAGNPREWDPNRCVRGHVFDEVNTYIDNRGRRSCRTCKHDYYVKTRG